MTCLAGLMVGRSAKAKHILLSDGHPAAVENILFNGLVLQVRNGSRFFLTLSSHIKFLVDMNKEKLKTQSIEVRQMLWGDNGAADFESYDTVLLSDWYVNQQSYN
jgi:hypothetical protein